LREDQHARRPSATTRQKLAQPRAFAAVGHGSRSFVFTKAGSAYRPAQLQQASSNRESAPPPAPGADGSRTRHAMALAHRFKYSAFAVSADRPVRSEFQSWAAVAATSSYGAAHRNGRNRRFSPDLLRGSVAMLFDRSTEQRLKPL